MPKFQFRVQCRIGRSRFTGVREQTISTHSLPIAAEKTVGSSVRNRVRQR